MQETVLISLPMDELKKLISEAVSCGSVSKLGVNEVQQVNIINRAELCKRLDITEPTAIRWGKKGRIPCFRIGSRVLYNWENVINVLESKKKKGGTNL